MVRGGICGQERTPLVIVNRYFTAQCYINILHPTVLPFLQQQPCDDTHEHDNARTVQNFFEADLPWPACLPDTSSI